MAIKITAKYSKPTTTRFTEVGKCFTKVFFHLIFLPNINKCVNASFSSLYNSFSL